MRSTIEAVIGVGVLYAMFAFVTLEFNPANWHEGARFIFVMLAVFTFVMVKIFPRGIWID